MKIHCKYSELITIKSLKFNPLNANKHSDEQIKRLAKILEYQGWRVPVKVSIQSGFITSGHGRVLAAKKLGWTEVPVDFQNYENNDMEIADLHADNEIARWAELDMSILNQSIGDFDPAFDLELLGLKEFNIDGGVDGLTDPDEVPEVPKEAKTKLGDIYKLGNHRLMCGDSTDILAVEKLMSGEKADMVFTDPPYGINYNAQRSRLPNSKKYKDIIGDDKPPELGTVFLFDCIKLIWGANNFTKLLPFNGLWACWDKRSDNIEGTKADGMIGSDFELAWISKKSGYYKIFRVMHGGSVNKDGGEKIHPTQKPTKLIIDCFEHYAKDSVNIVDLFGGSGSTLIACEKTNRKCFMMELDPIYCDAIVQRWEKFTGNKAMLMPISNE